MAPRSRGADALQAATATGSKADPPAAPAPVPAGVPAAAQEPDIVQGAVDYALEGYSPVMDLKGLCAIEHGEREPLRSMQLLLFLDGRCTRVPNSPGKYVVWDNGSWRIVKFPCWVVFNKRTKRKDELAVCVSDYFRTNSSLDVLSVESVMLPLRVRNNVYRQELRVTRFNDIVGFRSIESSTVAETGIVSPWSESCALYKDLGIGNYKDIPDKFLSVPLRERLEQLFKIADKRAADEAVELGVQDKRMADISLAAATGRLKVLKQKLTALPLEEYDASLCERIKTLREVGIDATTKTPVRTQIAGGTAPRVSRTRFAERLNMAAPEPAEPEPAAAPAATNDGEDDGFADAEEINNDGGGEEEGGRAPANGSERPKQQRRSSGRKRPASTLAGKEQANDVDLISKGGEEQVLLNRDGEPYTRGPYKKDKGKAPKRTTAAGKRAIQRAAAAAAAGAAGASGASTSAVPTAPRALTELQQKHEKNLQLIADLRAEVAELKTAKAAVEASLELEHKATEFRVKAARAEVAQEYSAKLHKQFVDGLRTGYSMATSSMPAAFGSGPPSARMMSRMPSHTESESNAPRNSTQGAEDAVPPFSRMFPGFH